MITAYRCVGIEDFVKKVKEKHKIEWIDFEGNNIIFGIGGKDDLQFKADKRDTKKRKQKKG